MKARILSYMAVAATLFISACKEKSEESTVEEVSPVRVETMTAGPTLVGSGQVYSGVLEETSGTLLSFSVPGTVKTLNVQEGQHIAKGQLIGTLDDASLRSNVEISKATLATAQDTYNRMKLLHESNSIPEMKWVEVSNALTAAKSAYDIAVNALEDAKLYSPVAGVVSQKFTDVGQMAGPGIPVIKVAQISPLKAVISVSESDIDEFKKGDRASVRIEAADGVVINGLLTDKGISADPLSRTYNVKYQVDNLGGKLLPGMLCNVTLLAGDEREAIVLPVNAVLLDSDNSSFVWLKKGGKALKRVVELGEYSGEGVVIASGLAPGDSVIVAGQQKVSNGMKVTSISK